MQCLEVVVKYCGQYGAGLEQFQSSTLICVALRLLLLKLLDLFIY